MDIWVVWLLWITLLWTCVLLITREARNGFPVQEALTHGPSLRQTCAVWHRMKEIPQSAAKCPFPNTHEARGETGEPVPSGLLVELFPVSKNPFLEVIDQQVMVSCHFLWHFFSDTCFSLIWGDDAWFLWFWGRRSSVPGAVKPRETFLGPGLCSFGLDFLIPQASLIVYNIPLCSVGTRGKDVVGEDLSLFVTVNQWPL